MDVGPQSGDCGRCSFCLGAVVLETVSQIEWLLGVVAVCTPSNPGLERSGMSSMYRAIPIGDQRTPVRAFWMPRCPACVGLFNSDSWSLPPGTFGRYSALECMRGQGLWMSCVQVRGKPCAPTSGCDLPMFTPRSSRLAQRRSRESAGDASRDWVPLVARCNCDFGRGPLESVHLFCGGMPMLKFEQ